MAATKRFYSPEDVEAMGIASKRVQAVWRCRGDHNIPVTRVGRKILYPIDQFERWLADRTKNSTTVRSTPTA